MKNYIITVNGTAYEVTVEENENGAAAPAAPKAAPKRLPRRLRLPRQLHPQAAQASTE